LFWHASGTHASRMNYRRAWRFRHRFPATPPAQIIGVHTHQNRTKGARLRCPTTSTARSASTVPARPQRPAITATDCQSESPSSHLFTETWFLQATRAVSARLSPDHQYLLDAATCRTGSVKWRRSRSRRDAVGALDGFRETPIIPGGGSGSAVLTEPHRRRLSDFSSAPPTVSSTHHRKPTRASALSRFRLPCSRSLSPIFEV
jgi:hypothetical protein